MLRLENLRKSFGALVAVDGVTLETRTGEVFGLLGPNGAGKSTTIAMAVGLLAPDAGSVSIEGRGDPRDRTVRRALGVAPQSLAIYDDLSARENAEFFGRLYGLRGKSLRERAAFVLEAVGLTPRARDRVGGFSGGMKRRLNLAVALVHDPPLLLLDEPTAGVDPQSRNNILDLVRALAREGKTILYTTHYMEEAEKLCDRVGIIDKGRLLEVGAVSDLIEKHGGDALVTVQRRRGEAPSESIRTPDPAAELRRVLTQPDVTGVSVERPDLETVFLSLTGRRLRD